MPGRHIAEMTRLLLESATFERRRAGSSVRRQDRRLGRLIRYAARFSPFYADLLRNAGLKPSDFRTTADLARLPTLHPHVVLHAAASIASTEVNPVRCVDRHTTGTTGHRLTIPTTRLETAFETLMLVRGYTAGGVRPWHRHAKIAVPGGIPFRPRLLQRAGLFRRDYLPIMTPPEEKVAWLRQCRPDVLMCWASVLNEITHCLEQANASLRIAAVFSSSDMLWPDIRRRAEQRLQARITDWYGAVEMGPIAWGCPEGAMHLGGDGLVVELLDEADRPARQGRVVCTALWRYAFPLLRCELGDYAEWADGPCACGNPRPALRGLRGREVDLTHVPQSTNWTVPVPVAAVMWETPGVRQFQIVQEAADRWLLRMVPGPEFTAEVEAGVAQFVHRKFQGALHVRLVKLSAIRQPPGVKFVQVVTLERLARIRAQGADTRVFFDAA